ncbi:MAG: pyridoxal phosphate-dependent aminotransferase, partial [Nitrospiria bacterium]
MTLSKRMQQIKPSATMAVAARAKVLKEAGKDIISFGLGEPGFPTAPVAAEAGVAAIHAGDTRYTSPAGTDFLKDAIIEKFKRDHDLEYEKKEIIVSCGAKHTLYNIAQVLFDAGDEVIIPVPYWVTYPDQVRLSGATPVFVETEEAQGFLMTPAQLKAAITPRTKGIIFNSPSNPTGAIYTKKDYEAFGDLLLSGEMTIISDEIYEKFLYGDAAHFSIAALDPAIKQKTIVVNGVSKSYSMTGWRIGYAAGPAEIVQAMTTLQSQSTSNPTSISQRAAAAAITGGESFIREMVAAFAERRKLMLDQLKQIEGVSCLSPPGSFYLFPNMKALIGKRHAHGVIQNTADLASFLLEEGGVTTIPGEAFGAPGHLRLSFALSEPVLSLGLEKIKNAISTLGPVNTNPMGSVSSKKTP